MAPSLEGSIAEVDIFDEGSRLPGQEEAFEGRPILMEHYHEIVPGETEESFMPAKPSIAERMRTRKLSTAGMPQESASVQQPGDRGSTHSARASQASQLRLMEAEERRERKQPKDPTPYQEQRIASLEFLKDKFMSNKITE